MRALKGPAILFILTVGIFWKLVLTNQYTWLDQPDYVNQILPWYQFQAGEWHAGRFPLWDPYHWGGQSLIGQAQPGAAYPPNWILFNLPLRNGWIRQSYLHWYFVLIHYMGALFCYLLCRDLRLSRRAAVLAGAAFGLSGYMGNVDWPQMLNGAVWAPVVLLFFLRAMRGESPAASAALSGAALGFSFLSGHHQAPLFVSLAVGGAFLYYWAADRARRWRIAGLACVFGVFLVLTSGLQTLPAYEYGKVSLRWVNAADPVDWDQKVPYFVHRNYSFSARSIASMVIPGANGDTNPFIGLVVISLALLAIVAAWRNPMVRFFGALVIGGFFFALGGSSVFHGVIYSLIPMVEKARSPGLAILIVHLGLAVLAAYGFDMLASPARDSIWSRRAVPVLLALAAALLTGVLAVLLTQPDKVFVRSSPPGPELAALAALLLAATLHGWRRGAISPRAAGILLTLLTLLETGAVTGFYYRHLDLPGYFITRMKENSDIVTFLATMPAPMRAEIDRDVVQFNWGDWYAIDMFEGFCGVTKNVIEFHADQLFRNLFGVGYYVGSKPIRDGQVELFQGESGLKVYREPGGAHERVWSVHEAFQIPGRSSVVPALHRPGFDRRRQVFLLGAVPSLERCDYPDDVRLLSRTSNRLVIEADVGCRGMVIAGETFDAGWEATVDGKPAPILEAYTAVRGVVVEAGPHRIEMRYRPKSVLIGAGTTALGLLGALAMWIASRMSQRVEERQ